MTSGCAPRATLFSQWQRRKISSLPQPDHDPEHLALTPSSTELGLTASLPTGRSRAETREATGLQTGWRGGVLFFLMLHVHEERRWPRASSSTVSWAV